MIQEQTILEVADNSGAKKIMCIRVLGGSKRRYGRIGDIIVASVKEAIPASEIRKGSVVRAVIVRTRKEIKREDGSYIKFDENACVLVNTQGELLGTRVFGPVASELKEKFARIISLAPEVV